jgi:hypothetical protein
LEDGLSLKGIYKAPIIDNLSGESTSISQKKYLKWMTKFASGTMTEANHFTAVS